MIVVSDTSPIINLACVSHLLLLKQLYGTITIPRAVFHEIAVVGAGEAGATEVQTEDWIQTREVADRPLVTLLHMELDAGEAEAIALALELKADLLLLDERRARTVAAGLGIRFVGLLGVLIEAKRRGLLPLVRPVLDALITRAGFWVTSALYGQVLVAAGE